MEYLLLSVLFAVFGGVIAKSKNKDVFLWALIGLLFGPFGLIVAFLPSEPTPNLAAAMAKTVTCKKCQQVIAYNAKICRHCGTHFPYLSEPARSHVELIESLFVKGHSPHEIAQEMKKQGIRPATRKLSWEPGDIAQIIQDHIT